MPCYGPSALFRSQGIGWKSVNNGSEQFAPITIRCPVAEGILGAKLRLLPDQGLSFAEWLRLRIDACLAKKEPKWKRRK